MALGGTLARVIGQKPYFPKLLILPGAPRSQVPWKVDDKLRLLIFPSDPQRDNAVAPFVADTRAGLDLDLKCHPLIRKVPEAIARRRKLRPGASATIKTEWTRTRILEFEIRAGEGFLKSRECPMRS